LVASFSAAKTALETIFAAAKESFLPELLQQPCAGHGLLSFNSGPRLQHCTAGSHNQQLSPLANN